MRKGLPWLLGLAVAGGLAWWLVSTSVKIESIAVSQAAQATAAAAEAIAVASVQKQETCIQGFVALAPDAQDNRTLVQVRMCGVGLEMRPGWGGGG